MIRPFNCLCLLAAAMSGLYLYTAKHEAQMLDRDISRLSHLAQESRARAAMMRAEYDRLSDPDRLRELSSQVLTLQPTDPKQFTSLADFENRLPAVGSRKSDPGQQVMANIAPMAVKIVERPVVERPLVEKLVSERPVSPALPASRPATPARVPAVAPSLLASAQPMTSVPLPIPVQPRPVVLHPLPPTVVVAPRPAPSPVPMLAAVRRMQMPDATSNNDGLVRNTRGGNGDFAPTVVASSLGMARSSLPGSVSSATVQSYTPTAYQTPTYAASMLGPLRR